jgi:protein disulfide-isomerase A1
VNGSRYALVEFYAPWCSACKALQTEYLIAAAQLKYTYNNEAVIAKVDADSTAEGQALAARFNVTGFPTLIWFVNGRPQPYTQNPGKQQDRSDLVFWVVSKTDDITRALTDQVCLGRCPLKMRNDARALECAALLPLTHRLLLLCC